MKKIDLHIHTVKTFSDSDFVFSIDTFKQYVKEARLDAVAVTNHDVFDASQCREIQKALHPVVVFPGIEINVDSCHLLVFCAPSDVDEFDSKCRTVRERICKVGDNISVEELQSIFVDLNRYLLIPHSDKKPPISGDTLDKLRPYVSAGEVDSAKKFVRAIKDEAKLTPVLFSDARMKVGPTRFLPRATYVNCGEITLPALKACLRDKSKVALSESDGISLWPVFQNGQQLSTGLNVIVGARSTGKTHTLNEIEETVESVKYIRQFELVQQDDGDYEKRFRGDVERRRGAFVDDYLSGLKRVIDDVVDIDPVGNDGAVEGYITTLLKAAAETDRQDAFSKSTLFDEAEFAISNTETLEKLISSVRQVIENVTHRDVIEKHIDRAALKRLACELIELYWAKTLDNTKKSYVNKIIQDAKQVLSYRSSASPVSSVDLFAVAMDNKRLERFSEIVGFLKKKAVIFEESIQGFRVEASRAPFAGSGELKDLSQKRTAFSDAFREYGNPVRYLQGLKEIQALRRSDLYKYFVKISYRILNKDGFEVSGGERSEYRLLQEISDAKNFDILLIDEPESSFDNLFLRSDVNQILKSLSENMPVVVVTHNNTVGASIGADYLLFTRKEVENGKVIYRVYSGHPTDKELRSADGSVVRNHDALMDSLEAGAAAYEFRRSGYEAIKN